MTRPRRRARRQRGVALVTAMLVIAIVATLATYLGVSQQIWLRQAQNMMDLAQADGVCRGAVRAAAVLLQHDFRNGTIDHLNEDWSKAILPLSVEDGFVTIQIVDAQSRFNLNNLVLGNAAVGDEVTVFRNLLTNLDLDPNLANAVVDWLDGNSNVEPGGAEDLDYLNHDPPYRAANQALESVDELRRVKGFTDEALTKLRPFVVALPGRRPVNLNTAGADVLAALAGLPKNAVAPVVRTPATKPFGDVKEFMQQLQLPKITGGADIKTSFFLVTVEAHIGRSVRRMEALVERLPNGAGRARWQQQAPIQIRRDAPQT